MSITAYPTNKFVTHQITDVEPLSIQLNVSGLSSSDMLSRAPLHKPSSLTTTNPLAQTQASTQKQAQGIVLQQTIMPDISRNNPALIVRFSFSETF